MQKEEQMFYVGIKEPVELRKAILESIKGVLQSLKKYEELRPIREEKIRLVLQLKGEIREINNLVTKLKTELPKTEVGILQKEAPEAMPKAESESKKKAVKTIKPAPKKEIPTELEKLEAELSSIESKLSAIK